MADAAFILGSTLASLGLSEATVKRLLAEKLASSDENRAKSLMGDQQGASGRGMLQSSATLQTLADTNLEYDRNVGSIQSGANDDLAKIAQQRLDAQAAYAASVAEEQAKIAAEQEAIKPGFDPADPFNWKGIQAEQLAKQAADPNYDPADPLGWKRIKAEQDAANPDPLNWKGIAAEQAAKGQLTQGPSVGRKPTPVKPPPPQKPIQPPRPGKVVRF
jgi:hypothetical protein